MLQSQENKMYLAVDYKLLFLNLVFWWMVMISLAVTMIIYGVYRISTGLILIQQSLSILLLTE